MADPTWLSDERIREIKHGDDATCAEVKSLAGEVRKRRRITPEPYPAGWDKNAAVDYIRAHGLGVVEPDSRIMCAQCSRRAGDGIGTITGMDDHTSRDHALAWGFAKADCGEYGRHWLCKPCRDAHLLFRRDGLDDETARLERKLMEAANKEPEPAPVKFREFL